MYDKDNKFTILELSRNSLELIIGHLQLSKGITVNKRSSRAILNPYTNEEVGVPTNLSLKQSSIDSHLEDIHYVCDVETINLDGFKDGGITINVITGKRFLHHLEKDFSLIVMDTNTNGETEAMEYFCGEDGDGMIPIPYLIIGDETIGDMIATACVLNN